MATAAPPRDYAARMLDIQPTRPRSPWRIARTLALLVAGLATLPVWAFVGFGLYRGHDVISGLRSYWTEPSGTTVPASAVPLYEPLRVEWLGDLESLELSEASGLALSTVREDLLFAHNDSGNAHEVFAFDGRGRALGRVRVDDSRWGDWEDMASFVLDGRSYLLLADVGDNFRWRRVLELLVLEEPLVPASGLPLDARAAVAWKVRFRYPTGSYDCEAVAVDVQGEQVLLLSKRTIPSEVYRVPLRAPSDPEQIVTAERIGALATLPQPSELERIRDPELGIVRSQPTGFDLTDEEAVVVTYGDAYLYTRTPGEPWGQALARVPRRVALPPASQREAGAISRDGRLLYVTSERGRRGEAALFRIDLSAPRPVPAP